MYSLLGILQRIVKVDQGKRDQNARVFVNNGREMSRQAAILNWVIKSTLTEKGRLAHIFKGNKNLAKCIPGGRMFWLEGTVGTNVKSQETAWHALIISLQ